MDDVSTRRVGAAVKALLDIGTGKIDRARAQTLLSIWVGNPALTTEERTLVLLHFPARRAK